MIKLIACDIDGTLLNSENQITQKNIDIIDKVMKNNIIFVPTTGRTFSVLPEKIKNIFNLKYVIFSNGAVIFDLNKNKSIYKNCISKEIVIEIMNYLKKYDIAIEIYTSGKGYFLKEMLYKFNDYNIPKKFIEIYKKFKTPVENLSQIIEKNSDIEKIYIPWLNEHIKNKILKDLRKYWSNKIYITSSLSTNIEICANGTNKGNAVEYLSKNLNIKKDEILVLGDNLNDLEMFKLGANSVAMGNAEKEIKEIANFITLTNDESGVAYAIEKFCF